VSKGNKPNNPTLIFETKARQEGFTLVIGVDEAGRGPLAGPVVAGAVALRKDDFKSRIADSKVISPKQREEAFHEIMDNAHVGIGIMAESVIDEVNILEATFLAMRNAVLDLISRLPAQEKICLFIDGHRFKSELPYKYKTIVNGDAKVFSIACASIVAKVTRDRILEKYDSLYPQYGFKAHKGYPTKEHKAALRANGYCPIHRRSFNY
jgi:ribonuclease HII